MRSIPGRIFLRWQFEPEAGARAAIGRAIGQFPAERFRPLLREGQAETGTAGRTARPTAMERPENRAPFSEGDARPAIFHFEGDAFGRPV